MLAKLNSKISQKEKFAAQSKCSKCCPSARTQAHSRPCHSLMALSTTRCSRPDHVAISRCIVCYGATFKLVLNSWKDFRFYQVSKRWDIANWLTYNPVQNQLNRSTSDEVIVKVKRVTFFSETQCTFVCGDVWPIGDLRFSEGWLPHTISDGIWGCTASASLDTPLPRVCGTFSVSSALSATAGIVFLRR